MPTFYWNDSAAAPVKTTTNYSGSANLTNSVAVPLGRSGYRQATGTTDVNAAIYIKTAKMYLGGKGADRSCTIKVATGVSTAFTVNNVGTDLTEPKAYDVGYKSVNYKTPAGTTSLTMGFTSNGDIYWGRYGTTADSTTLWGRCEYVETPTAPSTPTASNITGTSFRASWSAPSDWGGGTFSKYVIHISTDSSFSAYTWDDTTNAYYDATSLTPGTTYYVRVYAGNEIYTDFSSQTTGSASGVLTVTAVDPTPAPVFTTDLINYVTIHPGDSYYVRIAASNDPTYSVSSTPALTGLTVVNSGGYYYVTFDGTYVIPDVSSTPNTVTVTATATNAGGSDTTSDTFTILAPVPSWGGTALSSVRAGASYNSVSDRTFYVDDASGTPTISGLPTGITQTSSLSGTRRTYTLSGTAPSTPGTYTITSTAYSKDYNASTYPYEYDTLSTSLVVLPAIPVWTDSTIGTTAKVGQYYSDTVAANYVYSWNDGDLPLANLSFTGTTSETGSGVGTISGTPNSYGAKTFILTPYNRDNEAGEAKTFTINVADADLSWNSSTLDTITVTEGQSYSDSGVSVNSGPLSVTYSVTPGYSLPSGIFINSSTGELYTGVDGVTATPGIYGFKLRATNGTGTTLDTPTTLYITVEALGGYVQVKSGSGWQNANVYVLTAGGWVQTTVNVNKPLGWGMSFTD